MPYIKRTIEAGKTVRVDRYYSARYGKKCVGRSERKEATTQEQQERNRQNAVIRLASLLNANFKDGDLHVVFTYQRCNRPQRIDEAKKNYSHLMSTLSKAYKKAGVDFKYIAVTEYENASIHHHIVLPKIDTSLLQKCWKFEDRGQVRISPLNTDGEYHKLAAYLIKETDKTAKKKGAMYRKRWNSSKGLVQPVVTKEIVDASSFKKTPKIKKGFYLKKTEDIELNSFDDFGLPKQSYIMVRIE